MHQSYRALLSLPAILVAGLVWGQITPLTTYQGQLIFNGARANGQHDFLFVLYPAPSGGTAIASYQQEDIQVTNGLFTTALDFGLTPYLTVADKWVEIRVRPGASGGAFTALTPRQRLTATPFALFSAAPWQSEASGNEIFYNGNLVGINTSSPVGLSTLHVHRNTSNSYAGMAVSGAGINSLPYYGYSSDGTAITQWHGTNSAGDWYLYNSGTRLTVTDTGNVGINNSDPIAPLSFASVLGEKITLWGSGPTANYGIGIQGGQLQIHSDTPSADIVFGTGSSSNFTETARITGDGRLGIGVNNPAFPLEVAGRIRILGGAASTSPGIWFEQTNAPAGPKAFVGMYDSDTLGMWGDTGAGWHLFFDTTTGNVGIGTSTPDQRLVVNGTAKVDVLEIIGADIAERFEATEKAKPGMVMEIDPHRPGALRVSKTAYNRRVAGIVTGANNLSVGVVLGNDPKASNLEAIALSGRVWTYCDATRRAITPGDLLTTSPKPGYAMAVGSHERARGAIIGKAMTSLRKGNTGMVLVLVNLQ